MARLWRKTDGTREGKYLVTRRDGTTPDWMWFVIGEADPAAPAALRAYADKAEQLGMDPLYVKDVRDMADEWEETQALGIVKLGDPDAGKHREDDPETIAKMAHAKSIKGGGSA